MANNIFGEPIAECSSAPLTGFFRDGCCNTGPQDNGIHTVCAVMTNDFLEFSQSMGNDLITPRPEFHFPGLKAGDKWCLCVNRWIEAMHAGCPPYILPEATHEKTLNFVPLKTLVKYAYKKEV